MKVTIFIFGDPYYESYYFRSAWMFLRKHFFNKTINYRIFLYELSSELRDKPTNKRITFLLPLTYLLLILSFGSAKFSSVSTVKLYKEHNIYAM